MRCQANLLLMRLPTFISDFNLNMIYYMLKVFETLLCRLVALSPCRLVVLLPSCTVKQAFY